MKKFFKSSLFQAVILSLLMVTVYSCSEDTVTPPAGPDAKSINGTVNFVDTNFINSGGIYLISAYPVAGWPSTGGPAAYDTINITRTNNVSNKSYNYKLVDRNSGEYVVSIGFSKTLGSQSYNMTVYECDTARFLNGAGSDCFLSNPGRATIGANNEGVEGISMLSWSDTAKKVY